MKSINKSFNSEYCNVKYIEKDNIVFLQWKKFCCFDDYRRPTLFASNLLSEFNNINLIVDARNGFEDDKEDVEWGFNILIPSMARSSCKNIVFIMKEVNDIEDEMDMWTKEFNKYFKVNKVKSYEEAITIIGKS